MNLGTSAVLLGKATRILPTEEDLPSLPTIDLKKKRKQATPGLSLPSGSRASGLPAQQQRKKSSRPTYGGSKRNGGGRGGGGGGDSRQGIAGGRGEGYTNENGSSTSWSSASMWKSPNNWWGGKNEPQETAGARYGEGGTGNTGGGGSGSTCGGLFAGGGKGWLLGTGGGSRNVGGGAGEEGDIGGRGGSGGETKVGGEMGELLALCRRIENECLLKDDEGGQDAPGGKKADQEAEFDTTKDKIEEILRNTRILINARQDIRAKKGTTLETVRLGGEIDDNITLLRDLFNQLSALYGRLFKQRKNLRLSDELLEARHADVCRLMRAIEDIRRESKRVTAAAGAGGVGGGGWTAGDGGGYTRIKTLTELQQQQGYHSSDPTAAAAAAGGKDSYSDMSSKGGRGTQAETVSEEDLAVMKRWKERDAEFDKQVAEIGDAIDRIADVTAKIGEKADIQHELIQQVQQQTDKTTEELQQLTQKVKNVIGKQSNMRFFTRLLLAVILIFLICFVVSIIYSRYIKY